MPRLVPELTDAAVRKLSHRDGKAALYAVGGVKGLMLVCKPPISGSKGSRSWILRVKVGDKRRDFGLGSYPSVGLARAREKARGMRDSLEKGSDPIAERKAIQSEQLAEQAKRITFSELAQEYIRKKSAEFKTAKQTKKLTSHLKTYAFPILGRLVIGDIERAHIVQVLEPIWLTKNETANRVRINIERILDLAGVKGLRTGDNPARWQGNLDFSFPARDKVAKTEGRKALAVAEMPEFWQRLKTVESVSAKALQFLILTAARSGEVRGATWNEIDLDAKVWTIPGERMKSGRAHRVPLCRAAVSLLESLPRLNEFLFPSPTTGKQLSDVGLGKAVKALNSEGTVHGMRATFRTWCQEFTSYPEEVCELALAHVNTDATRAAYARSELIDKRRRLMNEWAGFVENSTGVAGDNKVVRIGRLKHE